MRALKRIVRVVAVLLLAVLLPVQAWAVACAQICAEAQPVAVMDSGSHEDCGKTEGAQGKCCMAHVVAVPFAAAPMDVPPPAFEPVVYVAHWVSYIPEEPSPPPIPTPAAR